MTDSPATAGEDLFKRYRFDKNHHLGLGDIRLTVGQQEDINAAAQTSVDEAVTGRDRLWCMALCQTLLDMRQIEAVTKYFNEHRALKGRIERKGGE